MWKDKKYRRILLACIFASLAAVAGFFVLSRTYIKNLVYKERLNQMEEITHQMFRNLEDVIGNRWADVDVQCNYLIGTDLQTDTDLYAYLQRVSTLSNLEEKQITLLVVDSAGRYYTQQGSRGLLREMHYLEDDPEWVNYVTNSLTESDSRMVFLKRLDTPITLQAGTAQISLRYYGIAQSMEQLNTYFRCDAYDDHNSVYVLENNGLKLFNSNNTELLKGQNVYTVLSQMSYLHGSSFQQAKAELQENGVCYSNAVLDGTEYFYSLKQMENAAWTLAFLVPADDVATNTQKLVDLVTAIIIGFATVFSLSTILILWRLQRDMQRDALQAEQETNLRLENYNQQLTARNAELKRAQEVAVDALQGAERASKAKTDFLSNMSHDIRTPMNAIVGMTAIATAHIDDRKQVQNCLRKISLSSRHLLGLINDVLDMSKIESGKLTLTLEAISLKEVVEGVVGIIQPQIKTKKQNFDVHIENITVENVYCDSVRLNQVLLNLLSNATKYTPEGGSIQLSLFEEASPRGENFVRTHLKVKDNGIGMSPEFLQRIYESYSRADEARIHKTEGAGLGMAITKYIVDAMGGTIDIRSELNKGTEFHITIDLEKAALPEADMVLPPWNMLVVDDDAVLCQTAVSALKSIGVNAESTLSGESAMKRIVQRHRQHNDYQIILLDWKLPDMDGLQIAREIRRSFGSEIPILLISAYDWTEFEEEAREAGISGFISKPLFKSTLFYGLRQYMGLEATHQPASSHGAGLSGSRVLLAEDNELNWEIASELLSDLGVELEWAEDGQICLDKFRESPEGYYDFILMDLRMPHMTGYEAAQAIRGLNRADSASVPIIAMTADAFAEDIQRCLECGMNAHIAKPIDVAELTRLLKKHSRKV